MRVQAPSDPLGITSSPASANEPKGSLHRSARGGNRQAGDPLGITLGRASTRSERIASRLGQLVVGSPAKSWPANSGRIKHVFHTLLKGPFLLGISAWRFLCQLEQPLFLQLLHG